MDLHQASLLVLIVSVLAVAWQTREVARQARVASRVAAASVWSDTTDRLHRVMAVFVSRPELRPYFYGGEPVPASGDDAAVVAVLAEMLADTIEGSLQLGRDIPGAGEALSGWGSYAAGLRTTSPALESWICEHPSWYPQLTVSGPSGGGADRA